ncbi:MAG: hypothetical protein AAGM21_03030 [Pseudomonadota bacterium]
MSAAKHPASIHLWSGAFASQQLAFAHLLDMTDALGVSLDFDQIEIIPAQTFATRAAPYFATLPDVTPGPMTVLYACPVDTPCPFEDTEHLTYLGCHQGQVTRAGAVWS